MRRNRLVDLRLDARPVEPRLSELVTRRLEAGALAATVGSILIAGVNLLAFVRFDLAVLPVVLRNLDFVAVAFSAMVTMLLLLPGAVFGRMAPWLAEPDVDVLLKIVVSVLAVGVTLLFFPWVCLVFVPLFVGPFVVHLVVQRIPWKNATLRQWLDLYEDPGDKSFVHYFGFIILVGLMLLTVLTGQAQWVPSEKVYTKDQRYVGYVLEAGDHHLTIVEYNSRKPLILQQDDVQRRVLCETNEERTLDRWADTNLTLPALLFGSAAKVRVPGCADV